MWRPQPLPNDILKLYLEAARLAGVDDYEVEEGTLCAVANRYYKGDAIGWHADNETLFGEVESSKVLSISLGAAMQFEVRRKKDGETISSTWLESGDVFYMSRAQKETEHRALALTGDGRRINVTFRFVKRHHQQCGCSVTALAGGC